MKLYLRDKRAFLSGSLTIVAIIVLATVGTVGLMYWGYYWGVDQLHQMVPGLRTVPVLDPMKGALVRGVILNGAMYVLLGLNFIYFLTQDSNKRRKDALVFITCLFQFAMLGLLRIVGPENIWVAPGIF